MLSSNVTVCVVHLEPRTQDSGGGPDDEDEEEEERCPAHSGGEEDEDGEEEEEAMQWKGPGQRKRALYQGFHKSFIYI